MFLWGLKWQPIEHIAHCRVWQSKPSKCELQYHRQPYPLRNVISTAFPPFFHESSVLASLSELTLKFKELDPEHHPINKSSFPQSCLKASDFTITDSFFLKHLPSKYKTLGRGVVISSWHVGMNQPLRSPQKGVWRGRRKNGKLRWKHSFHGVGVHLGTLKDIGSLEGDTREWQWSCHWRDSWEAGGERKVGTEMTFPWTSFYIIWILYHLHVCIT